MNKYPRLSAESASSTLPHSYIHLLFRPASVPRFRDSHNRSESASSPPTPRGSGEAMLLPFIVSHLIS
jgi:hypothetical protein